MRAIEEKMLYAVRNGKNWQLSNTVVKTTNKGKNVFVFLFGNCIYGTVNNREYFSDCGYKTLTTASRLNALGFPGGYSWGRKAVNNGQTRNIEEIYYKTLFANL